MREGVRANPQTRRTTIFIAFVIHITLLRSSYATGGKYDQPESGGTLEPKPHACPRRGHQRHRKIMRYGSRVWVRQMWAKGYHKWSAAAVAGGRHGGRDP